MTQPDIVFWDDVGTPISPRVAERAGMGGSEYEVILIATELARRGKSVRVVSRMNSADTAREDFDSGGSVEFTNQRERTDTTTLVVHRYSSLPTFIGSTDNMFVLSTDIGGEGYSKFNGLLSNERMTLICLSQAHIKRYPASWKKILLPYMRPNPKLIDTVRDLDKYIFASSKVKGLHPTLEMWDRIKYPGARLHVYSPGYEPTTKAEVERDPSIVFEGSIPTSKLLTEMQTFAGMVLVNTYPEMWGLAPVLAEGLGCRMHVLYKTDPAALPEVLASTLPTSDEDEFIATFDRERRSPSPQPPPRDFSVERWIPSWERALFPM